MRPWQGGVPAEPAWQGGELGELPALAALLLDLM